MVLLEEKEEMVKMMIIQEVQQEVEEQELVLGAVVQLGRLIVEIMRLLMERMVCRVIFKERQERLVQQFCHLLIPMGILFLDVGKTERQVMLVVEEQEEE